MRLRPASRQTPGTRAAILLAEWGVAVAVFGRRKDKLDDVVARIREAVGNAVAEFGALHYGVNNAGMSGYFEGVADLSLEH